MRKINTNRILSGCILTILLILYSCGGKSYKSGDSLADRQEKDKAAIEFIRNTVNSQSGKVAVAGKEITLCQPVLLNNLYDKFGYNLLWSKEQNWNFPADSVFQFFDKSAFYGLFPEDYHQRELTAIRKQFADDSLYKKERKDPLLWGAADILFTDAFIQLVHDISLGRLPNDSISLNKDSLITADFLLKQANLLKDSGSIYELVHTLEPAHCGYIELKKGIEKFLKKASFFEFTQIPPKGNPGYKRALLKRLFEGGYIAFDSVEADSVQLAAAVKQFQQDNGLTVDGRAGDATIRMMNLSDREKFIRIAISMDKYKKLPERMPDRYIWVNTSSNYLDVVDKGKVQFRSKVICGKPYTRTPLLNGSISQLITYPQWVPPPSIVSKEILPAVKKNPGYLTKKGFSLLDKEGNEVDPYSVDWTKFSKGVPYRIVQGSGDANALGILKFHFDNKYSVYLHDTNQRYLFANAMRSLSHGCVRVQEWERLALYILDSDRQSGGRPATDSLKKWLKNKEKHHITVRNKVPVFIRYITCEGVGGDIVFYDDVYGDDKMIRQKYFASK